ncbi:MAG: isocitrate lyase/PEP mutase family protein [Alphaproteobacteria bacterium]|nr:isocitrate lyase/PEP mutase family protein [Alphaproteobacteria bacterium]
MNEFRHLIAGPEPVYAPLVFNPVSALLAQAAGFRALYLGGGSMGYIKAGTEANLSLTEMAQAALDIRTVCPLPLILDGACGWGDPMHVRRTIAMSEAAGFAAIEIEDQLLPKRAHHHIGIEHMIPSELMEAKIRAAADARRNTDFVIIGRTNALRSAGIDEALRRADAYKRAGADMLYVGGRRAEDLRILGERLPPPLMYMTGAGGLAAGQISRSELAALGFRLIVDPTTPFLAIHNALRNCYAALAADKPDPLLGSEAAQEQAAVHRTIDLEAMLEIERQTVEK